ncbi:MAG: molecular chaperone, partial [Gammaproteobacteria bacterium]
LAEWSQDADGRDQYRDSRDLVYFPQIMTVEPQERRIIRVGTRLPPPERERSYRLFIEEMPEPDETRGKGTQVAVKLRFGVPLFVAPLEPQAAAVLERVELAHGELTVDVRNGGNRHVKVDGISVSANGSVIGETTGWYVLPGVVRSFTLPLPAEACAAAGTIELLVAGSPQLQLQRTLDVAPDRCR